MRIGLGKSFAEEVSGEVEDEVAVLVGSVGEVGMGLRGFGFFGFLGFWRVLVLLGVGDDALVIDAGVISFRASGADEGSKEGSANM